MFERTKERKNKVVKGYNTAKQVGHRVLIGGTVVAAAVVLGPPFMKGFTEGDNAKDTPGDKPAPATAGKNPAGKPDAPAQPGAKVELHANTKLYNEPTTDGWECAYIPEAEGTVQLGQPKNGMAPVRTPVEGDGKLGNDNYIDIPLKEDCNPEQVWVNLGQLTIVANKS